MRMILSFHETRYSFNDIQLGQSSLKIEMLIQHFTCISGGFMVFSPSGFPSRSRHLHHLRWNLRIRSMERYLISLVVDLEIEISDNGIIPVLVILNIREVIIETRLMISDEVDRRHNVPRLNGVTEVTWRAEFMS